MEPIKTALLVLLALGAATPALAQRAPSSPPPPVAGSTPPPPTIVLDPWNRGPPAPPSERPYVQPGPQVAPPMQRVTPVAPLSPRVDN
jgi:hypothetical protein